MSIFGADATDFSPASGGWMGGAPDSQVNRLQQRSEPETPMVRWARNTAANLKRERQAISDQMRKSLNLANGGTPWWRDRPRWKIGTKLNYCITVPLTWTAILCDAKPSVSYTALDRGKQRLADIATAAWNQAYAEGDWERVIHDAVLNSRIQKKSYVRLTFDSYAHGGRGRPRMQVVLGEQVYLDANATCVDDAEIVMYEYRESWGSLCARFRANDLRSKLQRKYDQNRDENDGENQSVLSPPAQYTMPTGNTYYTPAYAASPNPPDSSAGTSGILVREFWTRPHLTIEVEEVQFLATGEPATRPAYYETVDGSVEPMRRVWTEGDVIYELPQSTVDAMLDVDDTIRIIDDQPLLEVIKHKVRYPLYPDGRLVTIVDDDIVADDRMNPLGYFPFAEIFANSSPNANPYGGPSDNDLIMDVYEQLVRMVSLVHDTANLTGNAIWRIPIGSEISNDDITNAPGAIQREDIQSLKYGKREPGPALPAYIMQHIKFLTDQIKELSGLSDTAIGKMPAKPQISTETMTMSQEASGVRFRDALASVSRCMKTLGEQFLELMARYYTSPVLVQLKNEAGVTEPVPMLGAYLTAPMMVEAKAGSRQPSGPSARLNTVLSMKSAGIPIDIDTVYTLLEELGSITSATGTMRRIEELMRNPADRWKLLGMPEPGKPGNQSKKPGSKRSRKSGGAA